MTLFARILTYFLGQDINVNISICICIIILSHDKYAIDKISSYEIIFSFNIIYIIIILSSDI